MEWASVTERMIPKTSSRGLDQGEGYVSERPVDCSTVGDRAVIGVNMCRGQELSRDLVGTSQERHPGC